jgi:hypothetical protein
MSALTLHLKSTVLNVEIHPHVHTAGGGKVNTHKSTVNAGMRKKVSPALAFLPVFN